MSSSRLRRGAFTLIELLVVITIIAILIALLLPAVQAIRAAARTMQCTNNLKNVGLAVHNYESVTKALPSGFNFEDGQPTSVHQREGWPQHLLPFVEMNALWDQYAADKGQYIHYGTPETIRSTIIPVYICPGDGNSPGRGGSGGPAFQGNYAFCNGDHDLRISPNQAPATGICAGAAKIKIASVTDGLSNTLMISEGVVRGVTPEGVWTWGGIGGYWGGGPHGSNYFSTLEPPNTTVSDRNYQCEPTVLATAPCLTTTGSQWGLNFARSNHAGGVNTCMGDGAVKFASDSVDTVIWRYLGTKAGNEAVGSAL